MSYAKPNPGRTRHMRSLYLDLEPSSKLDDLDNWSRLARGDFLGVAVQQVICSGGYGRSLRRIHAYINPTTRRWPTG